MPAASANASIATTARCHVTIDRVFRTPWRSARFLRGAGAAGGLLDAVWKVARPTPDLKSATLCE